MTYPSNVCSNHASAIVLDVAAEVIAGKKHYFDPKCIPSVAYTEPEVAWVGLTEKEAKEQGVNYESASFPWAASGRAIASAATNPKPSKRDGTASTSIAPRHNNDLISILENGSA